MKDNDNWVMSFKEMIKDIINDLKRWLKSKGE